MLDKFNELYEHLQYYASRARQYTRANGSSLLAYGAVIIAVYCVVRAFVTKNESK